MIHYSVIIPHYNTPELLRRCLDSIPIREDIQVIIIDDCSSQDIVDFAHFPGKERPYTEVYSTPQAGSAGRARNIGLHHAKGEWLIFADADDYFEPNAFTIFDHHLTNTEDVLYFNACSRYSDTGEPSDRNTHTTNILNDFFKTHNEHNLRYRFYVPWSKMVRRSLVQEHDIQFDEIRWANDVMFSILIGYYAKKINAFPDVVYCITLTHGSLMMQYNEQSLLTRYEIRLKRNLFLRERGLSQYEISIMEFLRRALKYGPRTFLRFVQLGRTYKAHFLLGSSHWLKNMFIMLSNELHVDKHKDYKTH